MRRPAPLALLLACLMISAATPAPAAFVTFDLGPATVGPTSATFAVGLRFGGAAADQLEAIQLSVVGSSAALTTPDYSRFSFAPDAATLPGWAELSPFGVAGFNLLAPSDPINGPFLAPSASTYNLGTLTVNLAGLAANTSVTVTLAGGTPGLDGSDAGGLIGGSFVPSFAAPGSGQQVLFNQPNGVTFRVVPEPASFALIGLGLGIALVWRARKAA